MNNEQTLELEIKAKAQEAKSSVDTLVKSLTNIENVLTNVYLELGHIEKKSNTTITKNITNVRTLKSAVDGAKSSTDKLNSVLLNTFSFVGVKNLGLNAIGWMNKAIDYTEQLNLFNVVFNNVEKNGKTMFSELGKEATRFQYKLNETFGTNKNETLYMQGIFQSMGETVGIGSKYSAIMSETMTKLTYDLASLYNKSEDKVAEALRAGVYAGQTKPLRSYGIDVTQTSLQPILDSLGIDEQVKNLSQAEKELLRYLATLKQAKIAMGDFANNLESPSNQMKIFKQQLVETKVALTSLFIGTFANIMPYANAFLMTIKEISKAIATMFGIELKDYNTGIASQEGIYDGIEDSANGASKAVKELKRQTLGFDEIHNINENKDNNSGTSVNGGIDQRLLDAIKGYDNGMDKVRMKATEIRDKWMEILGFTKNTNEETGEVYFTYSGVSKTLEGVFNWFKKLNTQGKIFVGLGIAIGITKVWNASKKLLSILGGTGLVRTIKDLNSYIKLYTKLSGNFVDGIVSGTTAFTKQKIVVKDVTGHIDKFKTSLNGIGYSLGGIISSVTGIGFITDSVKSLADGTGNLLSAIGLVGGAILTIGGALTTVSAMTTTFGITMTTTMATATAGISLVVGAVAGLITYLTTSKEKTNEYQKALDELDVSAQNNMTTSLSQIDRVQELVKELDGLVDANGHVKKSDEDRVNYILTKVNEAYNTEYKLIDGKITQNGKEIKSNDNLIKSIESVMKKKKAEAVLNAYQEKYNETLRQQNEILDEVKKITEDNTLSYEQKDKKLKELEKQYSLNKDAMKKYEDLEQATLSGSLEEIDKAMKNFYNDSQLAFDEAYEKIKQTANKTAKACKEEFDNGKWQIKITADTSSAEKTINKFGSQLNNSGLGIKFNGFKTLRESGGIFSSGMWKDIPQYANGGIPSHGSMFIAGENGAEIVGNINRKTEVLNQSQIASAIYSATLSAMTQVMSQYGNGTSEIDLHLHTDEGVVVDRINQKTRQTGVCPIELPTY